MDYEEAAAIFATHDKRKQKIPDAKKLANATWLTRETNTSLPTRYHLRLFDHTIITFEPECLELHDRGWFARTTFDRWNTYLPRGFRVSSAYQRFLHKTEYKTLAVIVTPQGTFPYQMPSSFTYTGYGREPDRPWTGTGPTHQASEAVSWLPSYVDWLLDNLLRVAPGSRPLAFSMAPLRVPSSWRVRSHIAGSTILNKKFVVDVLEDATEVMHELDFKIMGIDLGLVARVLHQDTFNAFSPKQSKARRTERTFLYREALPHLKYSHLRKELRRCLFNYFMSALGFTPNLEWNRRDS